MLGKLFGWDATGIVTEVGEECYAASKASDLAYRRERSPRADHKLYGGIHFTRQEVMATVSNL